MYTFLSDEFLVMKCRVRRLSRQIIESPWNLKRRNSRVLTTVSVFFSRGKDQKYSFRFHRNTMQIRYVLCQPPKFGEGNYRTLKDFPFPPAICRGKFNIYITDISKHFVTPFWRVNPTKVNLRGTFTISIWRCRDLREVFIYLLEFDIREDAY